MISSIYTGSIYGSDSSTSKTTGEDTGLGQDAFLKMFMAQVTNQDPLNPMENTEFTAQMATFSQLEQLIAINENLTSLGGLQATMEEVQLASYLGKEVAMSGNTITKSGGNIGSVRFTVAEDADVVAKVYNKETGELVSEEYVGAMDAGEYDYYWDGLTSAGQEADDGTYRVSITATDSEGNPVTVGDMVVSGVVTGYTKDDAGNIYLLMGDSQVPLGDIIAVRTPTTADDDSGDDGDGGDDTGEDEEETEEMAASSESSGSSTATDLMKTLGTVAALAAALL